MKKILKEKKGLTLLEIIIVIGIIGILSSLMVSMLGFGSRTFQGGASKRDIQSQARNMAELISEEIRYASNGVELVNKRDKDGTYIVINNNGLQKIKVLSGTESQIYSLENEKTSLSGSKMSRSGSNIDILIAVSSGGQEYEAEVTVNPFNGEVTGLSEGSILKVAD